MYKKWVIARTLLITAVLLAALVLAVQYVSAESPILIHVDGDYTPAYPVSTSSPTPTSAPTTTSNTKPNFTATPINTNPTTNPPEVLELTPIAVVAALILLAAVAVFSRKSHPTLKRLGSITLLITVLVFLLLTNVVYGQIPTPTASPASVVAYSLWFTNATSFPTDGTNCYGYVTGGQLINIGGIKPIASGFGSSADKTSSVVVLRNDGNIPINVTLTLQNVQAPSDIEINLLYAFMNNQTYQPYSNQWMGSSNVDQNPLDPEEYMWLAITVTLTQPDVRLTGTPNHSFSYSFDIEVTAFQA